MIYVSDSGLDLGTPRYSYLPVQDLHPKYKALTTNRLVVLTDLKVQDIAHDFWPGMAGRCVLNFLIELEGLEAIDGDCNPH